MEHIEETPLKKRRLDDGSSQPSQPHDQTDDHPATVATVPVAWPGNNPILITSSPAPSPPRLGSPIRTVHRQSAYDDLDSSVLQSYPLPANMQSTQPTQLLGSKATQPTQPLRLDSPDSVEEIQVLASSPPRASPLPLRGTAGHRPTLPQQQNGGPRPGQVGQPPGRLALSIAPPGTAYRAPTIQRGPARAEPITIDSDDDAMPYVGGSSGDDDGPTRDIKPTEPRLRHDAHSRYWQTSANKKQPSQDFSNRIAKYSFSNQPRPQQAGFKGTVFDPRNRDDITSSRIKVSGRQDEPKKTVSPAEMSVDDIPDYQQRKKVQSMREVLPQWSVAVLNETLLQKRGNVDDALAYLATYDHDQVEFTSPVSERDYLASSPTLSKLKPTPKPQAKQTVAKQLKSLQERYAQDFKSLTTPTELPQEKRPRKRLVQGRRNRTPPPSSPAVSQPSLSPKSAQEITEISDDSDSGIALESTNNLLSFFNTCTPPQLMDLASIKEDLATLIVSQAPFKSLGQIRKIEDPNAPAKRKRTTAGEKVVDASEEMWNGYQAVDELVRECERISQPVRDEMQKWGVDIFGASREGEMGILSLKADERDSGIATPTTTNSAGEEDDVPKSTSRREHSRFFAQPKLMGEHVTLKEYQVVGVNWLDLLFRHQLSGILADDMGLGKTCQVVAFLARLKELGHDGPHIVVVPTSTLENWMREFHRFCSPLSVFLYHGPQAERWNSYQFQIEENRPNVIVTTYAIARTKEDRKFLRSLNPTVCVFDEGHVLKNTKSAQYQQLMSIRCKFRLLLTGTPLQNNLRELVSLLGFILPEVFAEQGEALESIFHHRATTSGGSGDDTSHAALLSETRIAKAKAMLAPFVLRRKKDQVLSTLPPKTHQVRYCDMAPQQAELYQEELVRLQSELAKPKSTRKNQENVLMILRKAAIHPWLFRRAYNDTRIAEMAKAFVQRNPDREQALVQEDLSVYTDSQMYKLLTEDEDIVPILGRFVEAGTPWMDSGKVEALRMLLREYHTEGHRTLVFSQFTQVLDILERVFQEDNVKFVRLDGSTAIEQRQPLLDLFTSDTTIPVFLLSTKAGGAGINLAAADRVVIFDSSFNPQDDVQAENRAHRVGQTRPVEVVRLVTRGTIEEQILELGRTKLALGSRVAGEADAPTGTTVNRDGGASTNALRDDNTGSGAITPLEGTTTANDTPLASDTDAAPAAAQAAERRERLGQERVLAMLRSELLPAITVGADGASDSKSEVPVSTASVPVSEKTVDTESASHPHSDSRASSELISEPHPVQQNQRATRASRRRK